MRGTQKAKQNKPLQLPGRRAGRLDQSAAPKNLPRANPAAYRPGVSPPRALFAPPPACRPHRLPAPDLAAGLRAAGGAEGLGAPALRPGRALLVHGQSLGPRLPAARRNHCLFSPSARLCLAPLRRVGRARARAGAATTRTIRIRSFGSLALRHILDRPKPVPSLSAAWGACEDEQSYTIARARGWGLSKRNPERRPPLPRPHALAQMPRRDLSAAASVPSSR